jgi:hypothetical protein
MFKPIFFIPSEKSGVMEKYLDPKFLLSWMASLWQHFIDIVTNTNTLLEIGVICVALLIAHLIAAPLRKRLQKVLDPQKWRDRMPGRLASEFLPLISSLFAILLLRVGSETLAGYKLPTALVDTAARLVTACHYPAHHGDVERFELGAPFIRHGLDHRRSAHSQSTHPGHKPT